MVVSKQNIYILILICLLITACSGTRLLPPGEKLYTTAKIKLESPTKIENKGSKKAIAENSVRPVPNKKILGMRPKLWMYMKAGEFPKNKFKRWLKRNGEAPVYLSNAKPRITSSIIDANFFNIGIFKSSTEFKIIEKKRTAKIIYISHIHEPYKVKELIYSVSDVKLNQLIYSTRDKTIIIPGEEYNLSKLKNERIRLDIFLKNEGYFYFNPDYLFFKVDTSDVSHTVTLKLTLKDNIPKEAMTSYRINNVFIDQEYSLNEEIPQRLNDTIQFQNYVFFGKETDLKIKPNVILRSVYFKKNDIYSRENHTITLNRLMNMGNFKFVSMKFSESDTSSPGFLDVRLLMTPMPKRTFRTEIELVSKSNNYIGPRMNFSLLNRNTFKGAELLNLNIAGSFETQFFGKGDNLYSYSINPQMELSFPRIVVPFNIKRSDSKYIPKTSFSLSYNYLKRVNYFDMHTLQFIYGFKWKNDILTEHELNPINISFTSILNKSATFIELMSSNPFLKKSYEEQFIAAANYSFTYNEQVQVNKRIQYYLYFTSEVAGNAFSLVKLIEGGKISSENPSKIIGSVYSQFARLSADSRAYYNLKNKNKFVFRFFAGLARPYGNSSVLPYTKQFFSGGPNSIRAFHINSVGPGTFNQNTDNKGFLQLGGDVKLEMNAEYRFTVYRFLKAALFTDAGNVWLLKSNPSNTGSPFIFSGFYNEIAVGAGFGFRIDVSFFILRFDFAIPLRKPWLEEKNRWVADKINFGNSSWRNENLILNVAIGYPF
ncbi:MAG: BamA/TamA family outer membrane protein [Bacteroidales bacterium]